MNNFSSSLTTVSFGGVLWRRTGIITYTLVKCRTSNKKRVFFYLVPRISHVNHPIPLSFSPITNKLECELSRQKSPERDVHRCTNFSLHPDPLSGVGFPLLELSLSVVRKTSVHTILRSVGLDTIVSFGRKTRRKGRTGKRNDRHSQIADIFRSLRSERILVSLCVSGIRKPDPHLSTQNWYLIPGGVWNGPIKKSKWVIAGLSSRESR